jgi:hypothetical protein
LSSCSTFAEEEEEEEEEAVASLDDEEEEEEAVASLDDEEEARSARNFASMAAKFACVSSEDDALTNTEFLRPLRVVIATTPTRVAVARFPIRICFCAPPSRILENDDDVFFAATTTTALGVVLATEKREDMFYSDSAFTCALWYLFLSFLRARKVSNKHDDETGK